MKRGPHKDLYLITMATYTFQITINLSQNSKTETPSSVLKPRWKIWIYNHHWVYWINRGGIWWEPVIQPMLSRQSIHHSNPFMSQIINRRCLVTAGPKVLLHLTCTKIRILTNQYNHFIASRFRNLYIIKQWPVIWI